MTAAAEADRYLSRVPAQLAEVDIGGPLAPRMGKDHLARFRDIMFDSRSILLAARLGIEDARPEVEHTIAQVDDLRAQLDQQVAWRRTRLAEIDQAGSTCSPSGDGKGAEAAAGQVACAYAHWSTTC